MHKKRKGALLTSAGGIAFGCLLAIIGAVNVFAPGALTLGEYDGGGVPGWVSGSVLIVVGVGIAVPFAIEFRRSLRKE